jgi:glycosyltransferase involved in cell wall biosynthesis
MTQKEVSVIIPNYNHSSHLRQRIDSVLNQSFRNFELVILDDCSTDGSQSIIEEYRNNPLVTTIILNKKNQGSPFKQWKLGVDHAKGDWIWIAESDDYADVKFLEKLMNAARAHPSAGLVYCDSNVVEGDSVLTETFADIKNIKHNTSRWNSDYFNSGVNEIENYLLPDGTINNTSAVLFKRDIFLKADPFDINLRYTGDKYAFVKVLARSDVAYVKDALNYFRNPFNTKSANKLVFYFYEQFLIFDWVHKNLKPIDKIKFFQGFYSNTRNSLFRDWGTVKLSLYLKLFYINPGLLLNNIGYNFWQGMRSIFNKGRMATTK